MAGMRWSSHRPAHSAHGQLYWVLVMWPLSLWPHIARLQRRLRRVGSGDEGPPAIEPVTSIATPRARPHGVPPPPPPPTPPRVKPRTPWGVHEGSVRPIWEEERGAR